MDKKLKETITIVKKLQRKELIYMSDSIGIEVEPNYQVVAAIVESLNLIIELIKYAIKQYVDTKAPVLINNIYVFTTKMGRLGNLYKRALNQIEEGKFRNYIF